MFRMTEDELGAITEFVADEAAMIDHTMPGWRSAYSAAYAAADLLHSISGPTLRNLINRQRSRFPLMDIEDLRHYARAYAERYRIVTR